MADIRTLLEEATAREPRPAPVDRVHAAVQRRTARRTVRTVAAAFVAVVFGMAAMTMAGRGADPVGPTPTRTPTAGPTFGGTVGISMFIAQHPDVFIGGLTTSSDGRTEDATVYVAAGVDPADWTDQINAHGGDSVDWRVVRCGATRTRYDEIMREAKAFRWPSGARLLDEPRIQVGNGSCRVELAMRQGPMSERDRDAARDRWGRDVSVATYVGEYRSLRPSPVPTSS